MRDLVYASTVIVIIWGGIFFYLLGLDRRVRRLEARRGAEAPGKGEPGGSTIVSSTTPAEGTPTPPEPVPQAAEETEEETG